MPSLFLAWLLACGDAPLSIGEAPALAVQTPGRVRLVVTGDTGKGNDTQQQVREAMARVCAEKGCDAVVILGDLLYPLGMEAPSDPRADTRIATYQQVAPRVLLAVGNHDYGRGRSRQKVAWLKDWAASTEGVDHPGDAYTVDLGVGSLHVLDTNRAFHWGESSQSAWLGRTLPTVDGWRIVAGHHTFRSDGLHGNAGTYEGWSHVPWLSGRSLARLFDGRLCPDADLYLAGHDHNLQLLHHCGVQLVVSGAGASARPILDRGNDPVLAEATPGFAWIELRHEGTGEVHFFDADARPLGAHPLNRRLRNVP